MDMEGSSFRIFQQGNYALKKHDSFGKKKQFYVQPVKLSAK